MKIYHVILTVSMTFAHVIHLLLYFVCFDKWLTKIEFINILCQLLYFLEFNYGACYLTVVVMSLQGNDPAQALHSESRCL